MHTRQAGSFAEPRGRLAGCAPTLRVCLPPVPTEFTGRAATAAVAPCMPLGAVAEVAAMRLLQDGIDQRLATERLGQGPGGSLVAPHQRRVQDEAPLHAQVQSDLHRLDRVVTAVRVAGVVRLAHT